MDGSEFKMNAVLNIYCAKCEADEVVPIVSHFDSKMHAPKNWVKVQIDGFVEVGEVDRIHFFCEKCFRETFPGYLERFTE